MNVRMPALPSLNNWVYFSVCAVASLVPEVLDLVRPPDSAASFVAHAGMGILLLFLLTFPLGMLGCVAWWFVVTWSGPSIVTPSEAVVVLAPVFMLLGYRQWYVLIPRHFLGRSEKCSLTSRSSRQSSASLSLQLNSSVGPHEQLL